MYVGYNIHWDTGFTLTPDRNVAKIVLLHCYNKVPGITLFPHILLRLHGTLDENPAVRGSTISKIMQKILSAWKVVAPLPSKYKPYSIELLRAIITLWTNVRCFAFAKGWNEQFRKKFHKHGTRSTLKKRGTEEETN